MYQPKTISGKEMKADGAYPVFGANGIIGQYDQFNHAEPQLLITCRGATCGSVNVSLPNSWITGNAMVVRPKDDTIDLRYLEYYFRGGIGISQAITGAAQPQITRTNLEPLTIQFPTSLDEQRRIVAVLDKAFVAIATATANTQKNQSNARALFESYLQFIFTERGEGWKKYGFDEVCKISSKLVDPRLPDYLDLPHIGAGNMESKTGGIIDVLTAREEGLKSGKFLFDPSMVLYSKIRPYLMKACRPDFDGLCSADVYPLVPKAGVLERDMLFHILMSEEFTDYAEAGSARAGMPKVNREHLFKYSVWLPDAERQREIGLRLDALTAKCQQMEDIYRKHLTALAELKQSLLQKAFAGELITALAEPTAPAANDNFATPQGTAQMIAFAYWLHKKQSRDKSYKRIKAQKCLHNVESIAGIDLGRQPMKHRNGPHDEAHMSRAEDWAREQRFFEFVQSTSGPGKDFKKLGNYDAMWAETVTATKTIAAALERAIDPLIPMDMEKAELFATVHAAWNNLLQNGAAITDDAIVKEARDDWHPDKLKIPEHKFRDTIRIIKAKNMEPDGSAKYVGGQVSLF